MLKSTLVGVVCWLSVASSSVWGQATHVERPGRAVVTRFAFGARVEQMKWRLDDFSYNPDEQVYTLDVHNLDLRFVKNFGFHCRFELGLPAVLHFDYEFTVRDLPEWGKADADGDDRLPPQPESVLFSVEMSPLVVERRDDYYLERGLEVEYVRSLGDQDGCRALGIHDYPSYEGMVNWWSFTEPGGWDLIIGGLTLVSCNAANCWISSTWDVTDWPMSTDVAKLQLTHEKYVSDLTRHEGVAHLQANVHVGDAPLDPQIHRSSESSCAEAMSVESASDAEARWLINDASARFDRR